jgi:hypothetical protein
MRLICSPDPHARLPTAARRRELQPLPKLELSLDSFERKAGDLSEVAVTGIIPQLRLLPPFGDRFTRTSSPVSALPYPANDGRLPVDWVDGKTERTSPARSASARVLHRRQHRPRLEVKELSTTSIRGRRQAGRT